MLYVWRELGSRGTPQSVENFEREKRERERFDDLHAMKYGQSMTVGVRPAPAVDGRREPHSQIRHRSGSGPVAKAEPATRFLNLEFEFVRDRFASREYGPCTTFT